METEEELEKKKQVRGVERKKNKINTSNALTELWQ